MSVIVPCHEHGHVLGEALASISEQGVDDLEVVVVDDHSTDNTVAVAKTWGATIIRSAAHGAGAARNAGVAATTGEIVAFLDADDVWTPNSLTLRLAALDGHGAAFGAVEEFVEPGFDASGAEPRRVGPTRMAGSMLMTRRAWEVVGPISEALSIGEFVDWVARFDSCGLHAVAIDDVVLRRRLHAANTSRRAGADAAASYLEVARRHRHRQG